MCCAPGRPAVHTLLPGVAAAPPQPPGSGRAHAASTARSTTRGRLGPPSAAMSGLKRRAQASYEHSVSGRARVAMVLLRGLAGNTLASACVCPEAPLPRCPPHSTARTVPAPPSSACGWTRSRCGGEAFEACARGARLAARGCCFAVCCSSERALTPARPPTTTGGPACLQRRPAAGGRRGGGGGGCGGRRCRTSGRAAAPAPACSSALRERRRLRRDQRASEAAACGPAAARSGGGRRARGAAAAGAGAQQLRPLRRLAPLRLAPHATLHAAAPHAVAE